MREFTYATGGSAVRKGVFEALDFSRQDSGQLDTLMAGCLDAPVLMVAGSCACQDFHPDTFRLRGPSTTRREVAQ